MTTHAAVSVHHVTIDETWVGDGTCSAWVSVGSVTLYFGSAVEVAVWARHVAFEASRLAAQGEGVTA